MAAQPDFIESAQHVLTGQAPDRAPDPSAPDPPAPDPPAPDPSAPEMLCPIAGYVLETHIGFLLRRAFQRHAALFAEAFVESGLTPTQFAALLKVTQLGRVTQNLLGRQTAMDPATIQGVVRRLIERGLIRREDDPLDRRSAVLVPTSAAADLIEATIPVARAVHDDTLRGLSCAERQILFQALTRIC